MPSTNAAFVNRRIARPQRGGIDTNALFKVNVSACRRVVVVCGRGVNRCERGFVDLLGPGRPPNDKAWWC